MPEGEQDLVEETVMIESIENIVRQFANPNYVKPNARVMTPRAMPKPVKPGLGKGGGEDTEMSGVDGQAQGREQGEGYKVQIDE